MSSMFMGLQNRHNRHGSAEKKAGNLNFIDRAAM